jgi:hypothetical protein
VWRIEAPRIDLEPKPLEMPLACGGDGSIFLDVIVANPPLNGIMVMMLWTQQKNIVILPKNL